MTLRVLKTCVFLTLLTFALGVTVDFKTCPNDVDSCTIHEVRVNPCERAGDHAACKIRRRKAHEIAFDYTPHFDADSMEAGVAWVKSEMQDIPLVTLDRVACRVTVCPVVSGERRTYEIAVPIESKFPINSYTIRWHLRAPNGKQCCFTHDIKVVR